MGWDAVVFGRVEGVDVPSWRAAALREYPRRGKPWPFADATVEDETAAQALARFAKLSAPEYFFASSRDGGLDVRGFWASGTLLVEAGALLALLSAAAANGGAGVVHVIGFGEEHAFSIQLARGRANLAVLNGRARAKLEPEAIGYLERPSKLRDAVVKTRGAKARSPVAEAPAAGGTPMERARALLGDAPFVELASKRCRELGVLRQVGEARPLDAVDWLVALLDHPTNEVRHAAADALLYFETPAALEPLIARLGDAGFGGHGLSAVSALFKLRPLRALDELRGVIDRVLERPRQFDPVTANVLGYLAAATSDSRSGSAYAFERHGLPRDMLERDPRWIDVLISLAPVTAQGLEFQALRILVRADSPRAWEAFVLAARALPIDVVVQHLEYLGDPRAVPALDRAAADATHPHAKRLAKVADSLRRRKRAAGVTY